MDTLYTLGQDYKELLNQGTDPDIDKQVFLDTLEGFQAVLADKVDGYAVVYSELEARVDKIDAEIKRLKALKQACQNGIEGMKDYAKKALLESNQKAFTSDLHSIKLCKNGGKPALWIEKDTNKIPAEYMKYEWVEMPDKEKIEQALKEGKELAFAHYEERGMNVRIQ